MHRPGQLRNIRIAHVGPYLLGVMAGLPLVTSGCDGGSSGSGTVVKTAEGHAKRARQMEEFMKSQSKGQRPTR
jgi:hypothetical protein